MSHCLVIWHFVRISQAYLYVINAGNEAKLGIFQPRSCAGAACLRPHSWSIDHWRVTFLHYGALSRRLISMRYQSLMITAARGFDKGLLVIIGAEAFPTTEITDIDHRSHAAGRVSVDVDVDPPVDR